MTGYFINALHIESRERYVQLVNIWIKGGEIHIVQEVQPANFIYVSVDTSGVDLALSFKIREIIHYFNDAFIKY